MTTQATSSTVAQELDKIRFAKLNESSKGLSAERILMILKGVLTWHNCTKPKGMLGDFLNSVLELRLNEQELAFAFELNVLVTGFWKRDCETCPLDTFLKTRQAASLKAGRLS